MKRLACLLIALAACGGGTSTEEASLMGAMPTVKSSSAKTFNGPDAVGKTVLGWNIEMYADAPGADCTSSDIKVVAKLSIYSDQEVASGGPQALLDKGDISIVKDSLPTVVGNAAATLKVNGLADVMGIVSITEFHLVPDAMHADRIKGEISAGGTDDNGNGVSLSGSFTAPYCAVD